MYDMDEIIFSEIQLTYRRSMISTNVYCALFFGHYKCLLLFSEIQSNFQQGPRVIKMYVKLYHFKGFPGGPVVKMPHF